MTVETQVLAHTATAYARHHPPESGVGRDLQRSGVAALDMSVSSLAVVLNALRLLRTTR